MFYSDDLFTETKLLKKGDEQLSEFSLNLANWIKDNYGVNVLNISYDFIEPEKKPRIGVIVETFEEEDKFTELPHCLGGYIEQYQKEIAYEFYKLIAKFYETNPIFIHELFDKMLLVDEGIIKKNVFVYFTHFKQPAKEYFVSLIPQDKITQFINTYKKEPVWEILYSTGLTIFLYRDSQIEKYKKSTTIQVIQNEYYLLLKPYDEFNYFENEKSIWIALDSKENLDKNYEGSLFNYR